MTLAGFGLKALWRPLAPERCGATGVEPPFRRTAVALTDEQWSVLEPLMEACRPPAKVPPSNLRRTIGAILLRHNTLGSAVSRDALPLSWWRCRGELGP